MIFCLVDEHFRIDILRLLHLACKYGERKEEFCQIIIDTKFVPTSLM